MSSEELWDAVTIPIHPKGVRLRSDPCAEYWTSSTPTLVNHIFMDSICAPGHCHAIRFHAPQNTQHSRQSCASNNSLDAPYIWV